MDRYLFAVIAGCGAMFAIGLLAYAQANLGEVALLIAPFGATAVLVFGVPTSPLAQPRNVIGGHLLTATIGIVFAQYIGVTPMTMALATGLAVTAMLLTKTAHPPAGGNPLLIMLAGHGWSFLFTPVLLGAVALVLLGRCVYHFNQRYA